MDINSPGILDRFLDPIAECLTPEVAARIVRSRPSRRLQARVDELAHKANEDSLSEGERDEYRDIVGKQKGDATRFVNGDGQRAG